MPQARGDRAPRKHTGIQTRQSRACRYREAKYGRVLTACSCEPSYRAFVYDRRSGQKVRKTFPTLAAARGWRADAISQINRGRKITQSGRTLREAAEAWLEGAKAEPPTILTGFGLPCKPAALRGYESDLRRYVLGDLGGARLSDIHRGAVSVRTLQNYEAGRFVPHRDFEVLSRLWAEVSTRLLLNRSREEINSTYRTFFAVARRRPACMQMRRASAGHLRTIRSSADPARRAPRIFGRTSLA